MKKATILSLVILALLVSCNNSSNSDKSTSQAIDTTKLKTGEVYYQCEMHPEVLSDKPEKCSKCDMDLMKIEKK